MHLLGSYCDQNAFAVGVLAAPLRTPLEELTVLPQTSSWWKGGSLPPPQEPLSRSRLSGLRSAPSRQIPGYAAATGSSLSSYIDGVSKNGPAT